VACRWIFGGEFSSGWIFHPLDDPYRLLSNNDAGSSGIAENMAKFFGAFMHPIDCIFDYKAIIPAMVLSGFRKTPLPERLPLPTPLPIF